MPECWLKQLKDNQLIEYRGAPKTGGYSPKNQQSNPMPSPIFANYLERPGIFLIGQPA
ncbi:MAG: hypothetical protein ACD_23C00892G0001 [uncultured bacterium]|nr:MAG: hypothetical protein ACD_23C00892G0001 [uncultured bacterium]